MDVAATASVRVSAALPANQRLLNLLTGSGQANVLLLLLPCVTTQLVHKCVTSRKKEPSTQMCYFTYKQN